ncbi:phosphoribosyltransferase family protein [Myroides sp. JBRI-B21084]|uniref:phosphoribosyltransferase n=1 Tax=Myroides sp. JBRI-B21084 TaxID=3119977 RepID=UPI0026E43119|nr:phosphoribosyltransferase family protein [Paenimyroides cloacae]WKW45649.1 phosphoribosyltransferase family protein [Paenimyroides cloacae]
MKVITFNEKQLKEKAFELVNKIDFQPHLIVGVLNGAQFFIDEFKSSQKFKDCHFSEIKLQRNSENIKKKPFTAFLLKHLPYFILNFLRNIESYKVKTTIKKSSGTISKPINFNYSSELPENITKILIIDDAIDSGKTIQQVKNTLQNKFPNAQIKTAVFVCTLKNALIKPNYYLYQNVLIRFPWSKDFKK